MDSPDDMDAVIPVVVGAGVDFIVLHFRTVSEMYRPATGGLERLARAVSLAGQVPVIGSGDIFKVGDALAMHEASGCRGVAVARGLLRNPFLIRRTLSYLENGKFEGFPEESTAIEMEQSQFFEALLAKAGSDPKRLFRRPHILELARSIWGEKDPRFKDFLRSFS
jgi:tRNA-dihydrouridine synthase